MQKKVSSYADLIREWEKLLNAVKENGPALPSAEAHRVAMQALCDEVKEAKARQDALQAQRLAVTQGLDGLVKQGKDASIRLRGAARIDLGPRNEQLVHFGVAPLRKRAPRATKAPAPQPATVPPKE